MQEKLEKEIGKLVANAAGLSEDEAKSTLDSPKNNFGDVASTVSFMLAKRDRKKQKTTLQSHTFPTCI